MKYQIYGDGIHDDQPGIQERIDSGTCELILPAPEKFYLITKPLVLPSHFRLVLPRYAEIRLADGSDCVMLRNRWRDLPFDAEKSPYEGRDRFWRFTEMISTEKEDCTEDIEIVGGIWNFNNRGQAPNPLVTHVFDDRFYTGVGMQFFNVRNFRMADLTLKDPVTFAVMMDMISDFTVENITFDFNFGNPIPVNMDGIHVDGCSHRGVIRNLRGACYDDLVALNAHEGTRGPITDIVVDGISAEDCHSAVRMLALEERMERIHVTNVFGTYYQYCIGLTKFYKTAVTDGFDGVTIDHVYASKALRRTDGIFPYKPTDRVYPFIFIQDGVIVRNLAIRSVFRREENTATETVYVGKCVEPIESLIIEDVRVINETGKEMPVICNKAEIRSLRLSSVRTDSDSDPILQNNGTIEKLTEQ